MLTYKRKRILAEKADIPFSYQLQSFKQKNDGFSFPVCGDIYFRIKEMNPYVETHPDILKQFATVKEHQDELRRIINLNDAPGHPDAFSKQRVGALWLRTIKRGILADLHGEGKTVQSLIALDDAGAKYPLVLCQRSKIQDWIDHIVKWTKYEVMKFDSSTFDPDFWEPFTIIVMTPESAIRYYHKLYDADAVIIDEAHKLRNRKTGLFDGIKRIAQKVEYLFLLSADPVINHIDDIWTLLYLCDKDRFGSYWGFVFRFCEITFDTIGMKVGPLLDREKENLDRILSVYMLARGDESSSRMKWETIEYKMSGAQMKIYQDFDGLGEAFYKGKEVSCLSGLAIITRKRQTALDPKLIFPDYDGPSKVSRLIAPIRSWKGKSVIFTQYADFAKIISEYLNYHGITCGLYTGAHKSQKTIDSFKEGELEALAITYKSGGEGLDLFVASQVILAEYPWHMSGVKQAIKRIDRYGQMAKWLRAVIIHTVDSVEDDIREIIREKKKVTLSEIRRKEKLRLDRIVKGDVS